MVQSSTYSYTYSSHIATHAATDIVHSYTYMQEEKGILREWVVAGTAVSEEYWGVYKVKPFLVL